MNKEIINKVANSGLITIDLEDFYPKKPIIEFDIKDFLFNGLVLKEKEFRKLLKEHDFTKYHNKCIAIFCSSESIIPMWAYMLISSCFNNISSRLYFGSKKEVLQKIMLENITTLNAAKYQNAKVVVKGCGNTPLSEELYIGITQKLQNSVSSLMFGEACSAVPIYKKKKNESKNI